ncbi:MAG TPA: hypothetical protein VM118_13085 [Acidobacteriota bacterium]|nr:hypothetical protein [Acidobacteriota bacterium]
MHRFSPVGIVALALLGALLGDRAQAQTGLDLSIFDGAAGTTGGSPLFESSGRPQRLARTAIAAPATFAAGQSRARATQVAEYEAGGDVLRSFLTLPSVADPNSVTPGPSFSSPRNPAATTVGLTGPAAFAGRYSIGGTIGGHGPGRRSLQVVVRPVPMPRVGTPHLWAGLGTVLGGVANMHLSGYRLGDFKFRVNSWESERIALREQGADMVQHFILGYGLTQFFLDNGSSPLAAGASAFAYEFVAGEVFESFPQAGGISWRDVVFDVIAVTVGVVDHGSDSPLRFRASSRIDARLSAPSEFDPYRFSLGVAVGRIGGLELIAAVESWKDHLPIAADLRVDPDATTTYLFTNY